MKSSNKYHEILFYLEACESGSMFNNLLGADSRVFAATAANPTESSWACYWDSDRNAYLGDTFAVVRMSSFYRFTSAIIGMHPLLRVLMRCTAHSFLCAMC